jgi:hypothetical protein
MHDGDPADGFWGVVHSSNETLGRSIRCLRTSPRRDSRLSTIG